MFLDISQALRTANSEVPFQVSEVLEMQEIYGQQITFDDVSIQGTFSCVDDQENILLCGTMQTVTHARCAKCLEDASYPIDLSFREMFVKDADPDDPDAEAFAYRGHTISLEGFATALLIPELPMRFLCKEDCKGLCPACGANLNLGGCNCGAAGKDNPFAALQQLFND